MRIRGPIRSNSLFQASPILYFSGVSVLSLAEFVSRLLWAEGLAPSASPAIIYTSSLPVTLAELDSLLCEKQFILALVRSADSDSSLSPEEKSLLSSLIVSVLLPNFAYLTEIVITLLREHIQRTVKVNYC